MIGLNLGNQFENDAVKLFEIIRKKMKEQLSGHIFIDHHNIAIAKDRKLNKNQNYCGGLCPPQ